MRRGFALAIVFALAAVACRDSPSAGGAAAGVASAAVAPAPGPVAAVPEAADATAVPVEDLVARHPAFADGLRLYRGQYCGICHTFAAAETAGAFGPTHDDMRRTALSRIRNPQYTGAAKTPEEYVRESIVRPGAYRVVGYEMTRFVMPAYVNLSEADVDALVHLLLDFDAGGP